MSIYTNNSPNFYANWIIQFWVNVPHFDNRKIDETTDRLRDRQQYNRIRLIKIKHAFK